MASRLFQEGKYCWCGCGEETNIYRGKHRRFIWGHDQRGKKHPYVKSGKDNHSYKGASCKATYYYIRTQKPKPDHCDRCGILEAEIDSTIKSPGRTKSKLILSNVSSKQDTLVLLLFLSHVAQLIFVVLQISCFFAVCELYDID